MKQLYRIIAVMLCIVLFTACNGKAADIDKSSSTASQPKQSQQSTKEPSPLDLAKQENSDTVAWLRIPGTDIDNSVMQTANNEDYMRKDENGKYDIWGSYFADYYSVLINRSSLKQNTVIYGHSESSNGKGCQRKSSSFLHRIDVKMCCFCFGDAKAVRSVAENSSIKCCF